MMVKDARMLNLAGQEYTKIIFNNQTISDPTVGVWHKVKINGKIFVPANETSKRDWSYIFIKGSYLDCIGKEVEFIK